MRIGVGFIADSNPGYPGYTGQIQQNAVTLAEILHQKDYATFATGKWHLTANANRVKEGPYDSWPLQRGFDNFYVFYTQKRILNILQKFMTVTPE